MIAGLGKTDASANHDAGIGRIRARTIVIGWQVIAIDNIGSIRILALARSWALAQIGALLVVAGLAATSQGGNGIAVAGFLIIVGVALILLNLRVPRPMGLSIGTCDGRAACIISSDTAFLQRLLDFLVEKINTRNEGLTASFDITHNTFNTAGGGVALGAGAIASGADSTIANTEGGGLVIGAGGVASGAGGHALGANGSVTVTSTPPTPPPTAPPESKPPSAPIDPDEALFTDDPAAPPAPPAPKPAPPPEPPKPVVRAASRTRPHDPLLDGPASGASDTDDWLSAPGRVAYRTEPERGGAGWLLPLALLLLVGGGGFAGWYFYSQSQTSTAVSLIPAPIEAPIEPQTQPAAAPVSAAAPEVLPPEPAPPQATDPAPTETPATQTAGEATPAAVLVPPPASEVSAYTPPELIVARASGLRYRARPSSAADVPILAETRAGGEALAVNGRSQQPDGEWYRVSLPDGSPAWFKASLTVPRSRFAETFAISATPVQSFAAAAPRILEPAEGVQLSGGAQPVRLAWQGPADASVYIVEIQAYDATAKRWIEDPLHKRATVEQMEELAEAIPRSGAWRWRVRGVSPAGEQSQFSRWSAFGIRD